MALFLSRLIAGILTHPTAKGWIFTASGLVATAAFCVPFGILTRFLEGKDRVRDLGLVIKGCTIALLSPGLLEEALYRAALLPHPAVDPPSALTLPAYSRAAVLPLLLFVASHLINPRRESRRAFRDWRFLTLAAALGVACTATHWATGGSLVACAVVHWLPVCVWLFGFGGYQRLGGAPGKTVRTVGSSL
ncbi:hypothetical protein Agub_g7927 [Astrephomene gubernaculifera]|uniref:CAAX prenyl protease 2/Lysostaphin resistance protein A-like domain-containing protein n=1 Tax=Astrephomene gubernaculifera TaxID=47775 RepID=A0AAD3DTL5_9CHLO|nr:hypothetical protein Agub_g7927 [Astrephomene gubernaculifera]